MWRMSEWCGAHLDVVKLWEGGGDVRFAAPYLNVMVTNWVSFFQNKKKTMEEAETG